MVDSLYTDKTEHKKIKADIVKLYLEREEIRNQTSVVEQELKDLRTEGKDNSTLYENIVNQKYALKDELLKLQGTTISLFSRIADAFYVKYANFSSKSEPDTEDNLEHIIDTYINLFINNAVGNKRLAFSSEDSYEEMKTKFRIALEMKIESKIIGDIEIASQEKIDFVEAYNEGDEAMKQWLIRYAVLDKTDF